MKIFPVILFLLLSITKLFSEDTKLWTSFKYNNEIYEDFYFQFESEFRFDNDISDMYQVLLNAGFRYDINDYFKVSGAYRTRAYNYDEIQDEMMINGYFNYEINKKLDFDFRLKYNKRWRQDKNDREYIRPRIGFEYRATKKLRPFVEVQGLYRINFSESDRFDEIRYSIGTAIRLPNDIKLEVYYAYHDEINQNNPAGSHILGIAWKFRNNL